MTTLSDQAILTMVKTGNRLGVKQLYDKYKSKLLYAIRHMVPELKEDLAEELVLHAVIKTWIQRDTLPEEPNFFSWLLFHVKKEIEAVTPDFLLGE